MILYGPHGEEIRIVSYRDSIGFVPVLIEVEDTESDGTLADCIGQWIESASDDDEIL